MRRLRTQLRRHRTLRPHQRAPARGPSHRRRRALAPGILTGAPPLSAASPRASAASPSPNAPAPTLTSRTTGSTRRVRIHRAASRAVPPCAPRAGDAGAARAPAHTAGRPLRAAGHAAPRRTRLRQDDAAASGDRAEPDGPARPRRLARLQPRRSRRDPPARRHPRRAARTGPAEDRIDRRRGVEPQPATGRADPRRSASGAGAEPGRGGARHAARDARRARAPRAVEPGGTAARARAAPHPG